MELADAAASYARMGWAVLPLKCRGKAPAIKNGCLAAATDEEAVAAWWQRHPQHNVGVATGAKSGGLVVIDLDVDEAKGEDGLATLAAWEAEHGELPRTVCAKTGRGGLHLFFRAHGEVRNSANPALGVDVRGEGGYVMSAPSVHPNGRAYEWVRSPFECAVAEADGRVRAFLEHVRPKGQLGASRPSCSQGGGRFELPASIGAGARNDTLFRYAASLQSRGFTDEEVRASLTAANAERCAPPLPASDVETIYQSVRRRYEKGTQRAFRKLDRKGNPTGAMLHDKVAAALIAEEHCCIVDGAPAIWDGRRYKAGWFDVERAVIRLVPDAKKAERAEVTDYLLHAAPEVRAAPARLIACDGGVLDAATLELVPAAGEVITNVLPNSWDPDAYDPHMDAFLTDVACGDAVVRANLEEVAGMCMYRSNEFGQCPVLIGAGSNGKSTFVRALHAMLGEENVSTLDIGVVGQRFQTGQLVGKLANLGDDISNERLSGDVLSVFKKVVTGEWVFTDVKNAAGFKFRPYCTLVFSCNEFPRLGDSSEGMLRRLFPIPFERRYSRSDAGYDPRILEKLTTKKALQYLMRLGVEGLRRLVANNGFTPNAAGTQIVDEVRVDNDSVLQWIEALGYTAWDLDHKVIEEEHAKYRDWCREGNMFPFARNAFTRKVNAALGLKSDSRRVSYAVGPARARRVFVVDEGALGGFVAGDATEGGAKGA